MVGEVAMRRGVSEGARRMLGFVLFYNRFVHPHVTVQFCGLLRGRPTKTACYAFA
jgi:hypothetical protein